MSGFVGLALRGFGKALKGDKTIKSVKPKVGKVETDKYKAENQRKLAQAKVKLKAMQKVDKDVEAGYQSVKTKFKDAGLKQKVDKLLNKKPFKGDK